MSHQVAMVYGRYLSTSRAGSIDIGGPPSRKETCHDFSGLIRSGRMLRPHPRTDVRPLVSSHLLVWNHSTGWWFEPLWKILVNLMIIPNIWENRIDVPNHQPLYVALLIHQPDTQWLNQVESNKNGSPQLQSQAPCHGQHLGRCAKSHSSQNRGPPVALCLALCLALCFATLQVASDHLFRQ